jgi:hypothetical protein
MEENEAIELLKNWDQIINPVTADELLFWLSSWIVRMEDDLTEADGFLAQKRLQFIETHKSVAKADVHLAVEPEFKLVKQIEKDLRRLKSARGNVKRRYEILVSKALQQYGKRY